MNLAPLRLLLKSPRSSRLRKPFEGIRSEGHVGPLSSEAYPGAAAASEQLSTLIAMIFKLIDERGSAIIQLNSPKKGEGTSTVAREIARSVSLSTWCKVALIDSSRNARDSWLSQAVFEHAADAPADIGLRPVRLGASNFDIGGLNRVGEFGLRLDKVRETYARLRLNYSLAIVDCPAVLASGEAATIASLADGIILVVEAYKSSADDIARSRDLLLQAGGTLFGAILNKRPILPSVLSKLTSD